MNNENEKLKKNTKFIVFNTINTANRKFYIGLGTTEDMNEFDGYYGAGVSSKYNPGRNKLQNEITKFGIDKFQRVILGAFETSEEAQSLYNQIVTHEFTLRKDVYNNRLQEDINPTRKILQYTKDGKFVKLWSDIETTLKIYNKRSDKILTKCLTGRRDVYLNSQWRYWKEDYDLVIGAAKDTDLPIYQYGVDGKLIKKFKNKLIAANAVEAYSTGIRFATQTRKLYFGYQWRSFIGEAPDSIEEFISPDIILQLDKESGEIIKEWINLDTAQQAGFKITSKMIPKSHPAKGFGWVKKKDFDNN